MKMTVGNKLHITGSITDENNTPVTGSTCTLKINNTTENVTLTNGTVDIDKTMDTVGDYDVGIGYDGVESTITSVTVLKAEPSIGVTGYTDVMSSSDPLNITATLLGNKGNPIKGASLRFKDLTTDYGVNTTDDDGKCSLTASNLDPGYHRFTVVYDGNDVYDTTRTGFDVNIIKTKKNTNLSISLSSSSINLGESVTVTGTLVDEDGSPLSGATVELMVGSVDSSITNYATISTDITNNDGTCTFTYTPSVAGTMPLYLQFEATTVYNGCSSSVVNLTVLNPTLFEDACNSNSGLSNYGTLVTIESAGTSASLEYDSTMNAYKLTSLSNGVKIYPITELNGKSNLSLEMEVYMPSDTDTATSLGFGVAVPETRGYSEVGFVLIHENNRIYRHHFVSGSFRGNTTIGTDTFDTWYKIKTVFNGTNTTTTVTNMSTNEVVVNNSTYDLTTLSSTFSDISKYVYGIDIAWSNGAYGYVRNIKAVRL